jgi:uncharacterized protein DUF3224
MTEAAGTFKVTGGGEDAYHEQVGGPKLTRVSGTQRFTGDIEGDGSVEWLMCYLPDGTARFAGLQRIEGWIGERPGTFVMESVGDHDGKASKGTWTVIAGSGTGDLSGLTGEGTFDAPGGPEVSYRLEFKLG